jgi:hypothetical protein
MPSLNLSFYIKLYEVLLLFFNAIPFISGKAEMDAYREWQSNETVWTKLWIMN